MNDPTLLRDRFAKFLGDHTRVEQELAIPGRRYYSPWDSGTSYGVNAILNRYCGMKFPGEWPLAGFWTHGWTPSFAMVHPYQVACLAKPGENPMNFVSRRDAADYLLANGFDRVQAVGLPFLYLPTCNAQRIPSSILVAPFHSPPGFSVSSRHVPPLVEVLIELRRKFELVVGCIHPQCIKDGLWIDDFKKAGVSYVSGANMRDSNSLYRMRHLFQTFEAVATNGFGSLLAYAALCGARVGVTENFMEDNRRLLLRDMFYGKNPHVLDLMLEALSEQSLKKSCSFLWNDLTKGEPPVEWARKELGWECRLAPEEAIDGFGLQPTVRLRNAALGLGKKATFALRRRLYSFTHK